jgi:hypothetical protein
MELAIGLALLSFLGTIISLFWQSKNSSDIAQLTSNLRSVENERQTVFSALHTKRIDIISELNQHVAMTTIAFQLAIMNPLPSNAHDRAELVQIAQTKGADMFLFFAGHRPWFTPALCEHVDALNNTFAQAVSQLHSFEITQPGPEKLKAWQSAVETILSQAIRVRDELDTELRGLLGVLDKKAADSDPWKSRTKSISPLAPSAALPEHLK